MLLQHPIQEAQLKPLVGHPVFVVMKDGTEHPGFLSRTNGGKIYLNETAGPGISSKRKQSRSAAAKVQTKSSKTKPSPLSSNPPFIPSLPALSALPSIGPKLTLDLKNVSLVFPLMI